MQSAFPVFYYIVESVPSVIYQGKNWLIVDRLFHLLVRQLVFPNIPIFHLLVTLSETSMFRFCTFATWPHRPPLSVSLIHVVTIPTSLCPSSVAEYNTMTLEGRKNTHTQIHMSPSCAHPLWLQGEDMQSVTIIKTKTAREYRAIE